MTTTKHRVKSGALAGAGTFACMMVASYQAAHEADKKINAKRALKLSGGLGILAGVLWSLAPMSASEDHSEVIEATKEKTYPSLRLFIRRMTSGGTFLATPKTVQRTSTYGVNHNRPQPPAIYSKRTNLDDFEDDAVSDEEYAEMLDEELRRQDKLDDPFYEGPDSIFDRV